MHDDRWISSEGGAESLSIRRISELFADRRSNCGLTFTDL
jgi:hypothetical protein